MILSQIESTLLAFIVTSLIVLLAILIFTKMTKYNDWEEISKGNAAAALALGGKVFGVANVMRYAILTNNNALETVMWGIIGIVLLVLVYMAFEWITPRLDVNKEIGSGNVAVGFMAMFFSVSLSFVIGASIS